VLGAAVVGITGTVVADEDKDEDETGAGTAVVGCNGGSVDVGCNGGTVADEGEGGMIMLSGKLKGLNTSEDVFVAAAAAAPDEELVGDKGTLGNEEDDDNDVDDDEGFCSDDFGCSLARLRSSLIRACCLIQSSFIVIALSSLSTTPNKNATAASLPASSAPVLYTNTRGPPFLSGGRDFPESAASTTAVIAVRISLHCVRSVPRNSAVSNSSSSPPAASAVDAVHISERRQAVSHATVESCLITSVKTLFASASGSFTAGGGGGEAFFSLVAAFDIFGNGRRSSGDGAGNTTPAFFHFSMAFKYNGNSAG